MAVITDLPDDLVRQCLLRVPYTSHRNLKAVCRSWEAMLSDPNFYSDRKISGNSDQLLCFLKKNTEHYVNAITVYDPVKGTSECVPISIPHCCGIHVSHKCVCVNRKLVLIGGVHLAGWRQMKSIYIYDFVSAKWSRGADIPNFRYLFAYAACSSTGRIYFAGGYDRQLNRLATVEAYDVEEDKWEVLPPMSQPRIESLGVCVEGKFMVLGGSNDRSAEVFDPREGRWTRLENMWSLGGPGSSSVPSGQLYALHKKFASSREHFGNATQWHDWMVCSWGRNMCHLVHLVTGEYVTVPDMFELSEKEFVHRVTTLEI